MEKKKILLIDDEKDFTRLVKLNLEASGNYQVEVENTSTNAIWTAKRFKPDLILCDVMMPHMDGGEVAFRLKDDADTKNIPILFLTAAVTQEESSQKGGSIGGHPFLTKPISAPDLIAGIEAQLRKK